MMADETAALHDMPEHVRKLVGAYRAAWLSLFPKPRPAKRCAARAMSDGRRAGSCRRCRCCRRTCRPEASVSGRRLDQDLQQIDMRGRNSWRLLLAEVSTVELLEVQLVNAVAPFIINARLKPLMRARQESDKHIVNVSAVEGQFYRKFKTTRHPHTNMAKAALNMMTRTVGDRLPQRRHPHEQRGYGLGDRRRPGRDRRAEGRRTSLPSAARHRRRRGADPRSRSSAASTPASTYGAGSSKTTSRPTGNPGTSVSAGSPVRACDGYPGAAGTGFQRMTLDVPLLSSHLQWRRPTAVRVDSPDHESAIRQRPFLSRRAVRSAFVRRGRRGDRPGLLTAPPVSQPPPPQFPPRGTGISAEENASRCRRPSTSSPRSVAIAEATTPRRSPGRSRRRRRGLPRRRATALEVRRTVYTPAAAARRPRMPLQTLATGTSAPTHLARDEAPWMTRERRPRVLLEASTGPPSPTSSRCPRATTPAAKRKYRLDIFMHGRDDTVLEQQFMTKSVDRLHVEAVRGRAPIASCCSRTAATRTRAGSPARPTGSRPSPRCRRPIRSIATASSWPASRWAAPRHGPTSCTTPIAGRPAAPGAGFTETEVFLRGDLRAAAAECRAADAVAHVRLDRLRRQHVQRAGRGVLGRDRRTEAGGRRDGGGDARGRADARAHHRPEDRARL